MSKPGRKEKLYPDDLIQDIIYRYTTENNIKGEIRFSKVYKYSIKLYENKEIDIKFSEDFWRRNGKQGKLAIEKINKLYEKSLQNPSSDEFTKVIDTKLCVDMYYEGDKSNKKKLISQLIVNEKLAEKSERYIKKIRNQENEIIKLKEKLKESEQKNENYEKILFSWFNASKRNDVPLVNFYNGREESHPLIGSLLNELFVDTYSILDKIKEFDGPNVNEVSKVNVKTKKSRLELISESRNKK